MVASFDIVVTEHGIHFEGEACILGTEPQSLRKTLRRLVDLEDIRPNTTIGSVTFRDGVSYFTFNQQIPYTSPPALTQKQKYSPNL